MGDQIIRRRGNHWVARDGKTYVPGASDRFCTITGKQGYFLIGVLDGGTEVVIDIDEYRVWHGDYKNLSTGLKIVDLEPKEEE
jgi:hypothetical protein